MADRQMPLFGDDPGGGDAPVAPAHPAGWGEIAAALPASIRLGTSSWSFPGWTGLVFAPRAGRPESERRLAQAGLAAYAACPLFRTVSLDRTFHAAIETAAYARYAAAVPADFRFVVKAPAALTDPVLRQPGSGLPDRDNPGFLDAAAARAAFVAPAVAGLGPKAGPLVFQFPPLGRRLLARPRQLAARVAAFIAALPRGPLYAVEVRDPDLASADLARLLADVGAVPCLAVHARMPPAAEQARALGLDPDGSAGGDERLARGPLVVRWNLHAGKVYAGARRDYFPFDRLVDEDVATRETLAGLAARAAAAGREVFLTINNKAEGSAPLSVAALAAGLAARLAAGRRV